MQTISTTELSRNTRAILDRVATRGEIVRIERNHTMIAQIMPPKKTMTAAQALADLAPPLFTPAQASAWLTESKAGFEGPVRNP